MKKLLLACAAASIGVAFASAETLKLDFINNTYEMERQSGNSSKYVEADAVIVDQDGVVITNTSSSAPTSGIRLWSDGLRFYKNGSIKVAVPGGTITAITMKGKTETTNISNIVFNDATTVTNDWTGSAESVNISYTANSSNKPLGFLTIEYTLGSSDLEAAELSFPEAEYSVKFPNGTFTAPTLSKVTDAVASYSSSNEAVATVDAETGAVTIVKPGTTVITAKCEANDKYAAGSAKYTLTVFAAASSLQDLSELAALDAAGTFQIDCPLTVTYVNKRNVYVVDAQGAATLIYMANAEDAANYTVGDVLSTEWFVTYSPYFGLPEYVPAGELPTVTTQNATFDIPELSLGDVNDDYICKVINIKDLTFDNSLPAESNVNTVITDGDASLTFRNTFGIPAFTPEAGKEYNVKGVLSVYENAQGRTLQFLPIEISVASGVASIEANEGVATYYDLNGRKVNGQLANGLYIRVLNGKASKVIVK